MIPGAQCASLLLNGCWKTPRLLLELAKQSYWANRALVRNVTKNPIVTFSELQSCSKMCLQPQTEMMIHHAA